jgi:hypothetical protein
MDAMEALTPQMDAGTAPVILFELSRRDLTLEMNPIVAGMGPTRELLYRLR